MISNTWAQVLANGGGIIISWYSKEHGPSGNSYVIFLVGADGKERATDPKAPWYYNYRKAFHGRGREDKKKALAAAQQWVAETYGDRAPKTWAKNRMGDYLDAEINKKYPLPPK